MAEDGQPPGNPQGSPDRPGADRQLAIGNGLAEIDVIARLAQDTAEDGVRAAEGGTPVAAEPGAAEVGEVIFSLSTEQPTVRAREGALQVEAQRALGCAEGRELGRQWRSGTRQPQQKHESHQLTQGASMELWTW